MTSFGAAPVARNALLARGTLDIFPCRREPGHLTHKCAVTYVRLH